MKKILSKVLYLALAIPIFANATSCPTTNVVTDAPLFQWSYDGAGDYYSGTLIMDEVTITLNNGETLTTRAYAQDGDTPSVPGPTIVMEPGKKYVLKFENRLPYEPLSTAHNTFKDPNVTNLHTHGLHTTGDTPGDDATRIFEGRTGGDYVFDITGDHMGGTFWIHAHHHGSSYLQLSSGALGMLLIDDSADGIPANVAAMEEKLLTMAYLDPSVAGTGGDMLVSGTLSPGWNVNGTVDGNICMPVNTWQHWRLLVAAADVKAKDVSVGSQCEVALMARDGVWRTMVPKDISNNTLSLTGGSRADIAVRCTGDSTLIVGNTVVANIYADPGLTQVPANVANPYAGDGVSQWASFRPGYLRDLRDPALAIEGTSVTNFETVSMGARTINGSKFDILEPTFITQADGVQEWNVKGATNHPFHLHVFHFQAQTDCGAYEAGEYYDTIAASCNVRFDLNPQTSTVFDGKTIFHCHLLDHEDQGAMGYMSVLPATGTIPAPTFPAGAGFLEKYELDGNPTVPADPSALSASAVSSSQIDLSWTDNATDEDSYQVEQSLDGVSFSVIAVLSADSASYSDTGLPASTEYFYRVNASNAAGDSGYSSVASATTNADGGGGTPTSVDVGSITVSTNSIGGGQKVGVADIVVVDDLGNPVVGAVVTGDFTGTITEGPLDSAATDANGQTSISTSGSAKGKVNLTFCVTAITHGTLQDFSAAPGAVCGTL